MRLGKRRTDAAKPLAPREGLGVANAANGLKPLAALGKRPKVVACCGQRESACMLLPTAGKQALGKRPKVVACCGQRGSARLLLLTEGKRQARHGVGCFSIAQR
jgi:hypothetical protein